MSLLDLLLRAVRHPVVTRDYPDEKPVIERGRRGTPELQPERCDAAALCVDVCPTAALTLDEADLDGTVWSLDYGLCIFCGRCVEACPNQAIVATAAFELAARNREDAIVRYTLRHE